MGPLINAQWLNENISEQKLVILDASIDFQIPAETEKDKANFIPNAIRFDYDKEFCDPDSALPHMIPSEDRFNELARQLGINNDSIIVVYDNSGTFASPRAWWMFKAMGHKQVYVLDGGLTEWKRKGYQVTQSYREVTSTGDFNGHLSPSNFLSAQDVLAQIEQEDSLTIDARSKARFLGKTPEPRQGIRSGHIPNAVCLPFVDLMSKHKLKPAQQLKEIFDEVVPNDKEQYIFSCGSGVTACILALAAETLGYENLSVYDGSWTEWGQKQELPIEV
ncbi:sulfurtransferase [Vibrio marisflavi]|uniref:3-mercaptopyruvate sulfurtransferase n=1 Tax=Vibrio marisflavi CECT 7928 TaxID=634439 RepID=A0ABN8DYT8_9VIBR|nr:sulfurtransferase [Vibrio marisflavi]CAH0536576.1 3-mercaptopyruvate sulfurtransferase [Vibrio marisflavi CECT 7928]